MKAEVAKPEILLQYLICFRFTHQRVSVKVLFKKKKKRHRFTHVMIRVSTLRPPLGSLPNDLQPPRATCRRSSGTVLLRNIAGLYSHGRAPPPPQEASSVSHLSIFLLMSAGLLTFSCRGGRGGGVGDARKAIVISGGASMASGRVYAPLSLPGTRTLEETLQ